MAMDLTRKEFLVLLLGSAAAACGGSSSENINTPSGNCLANGTNIQISQNTGHVVVVTKDDINAGVDKTYLMTGDPSHTHQVTLTAADFTRLKQNLGAMETSTVGNGGNGAHTHQVTVLCA
jgi:hypothetical protein